jgi:hypothetical protein
MNRNHRAKKGSEILIKGLIMTSILPEEKTQPKKTITDYSIFLYGPPKIGKTSFIANEDKVLFIATEAGLNALSTYQVIPSAWEDLLDIFSALGKNPDKYSAVAIDTIDNAYRLCSEYILKKYHVTHESDLAYGKGWTLVNNEFYRVISKAASGLKPGLWMISHAIEKEIDAGGEHKLYVVGSLPDRIRKQILAFSDIILYYTIENNERLIHTKPHPHYEAGDRTGKLPEPMKPDYQEFIKYIKKEDQPNA